MRSSSPPPFGHVAIFGYGGIGAALAADVFERPGTESVTAFSRSAPASNESGIELRSWDPFAEGGVDTAFAELAIVPDTVIVTTGILKTDRVAPEKSIRDFDVEAFLRVLQINAALPAMVAKAALPRWRGDDRKLFAALSARVGSISDNRLGGWHSYRASKAALNMLIRNISVELARLNDDALAVGLHPGTVDTPLSEPFQRNVPEGKLFTANYSAGALLDVLQGLTPTDSGSVFDYAGARVEP